MSQPDLIIHDEKDNVGVVVIETTKKGQDCSAWIMENDKTVKVPSSNDVPLGHKIALKDLKVGEVFRGQVVKILDSGVGYFVKFGNNNTACLKDGFVRVGRNKNELSGARVDTWCALKVKSINVAKNQVEMERITCFV